jgi:AcrR family transcriptional regulator
MTRKELKRETITQRAIELFASRDFHTVQMDEIAEAAGVSKGTLYNHFHSKEDLYLSTIRSRLIRLAELLEEAFESRAEPWRDLRSFIFHYEGFMRNHPHFFKVLRKCDALFSDPSDRELIEVRKRPRRTLIQVLEAGNRLDKFREMDPAQTADLVIGMIEARVLADLSNGCNAQGPEEILGLLRYGLTKKNGKEPQ